MSIQGSCHCGGTVFEVEGTPDSALACNCSICQRKGSLLWFVPRDKFTLRTPDERLATYTFNKHVIRHRFCPTCGIHPFGEGVDPQGNAVVAVNIRCLEGFDIDAVPVHHYNGRDI
ncbi:GFA family protein [Chitinilyticum litopenaei]|uniref:GFA family protein n=1 Tax=Chitinilyticum litopenaei TaxID=1121276 RepID=UPI0004013697|nr:GFA family protein [Chitinilyticum litopenaei]